MDRLVKFLDELDRETENVFFLGDIFDFWMGGHKIWQGRYKALVDSVRRLQDRGVKVYFFEGNHDIHIHPFWQGELGVEVMVDPRILNISGLRVRIEHGDLFNPDDTNYIRFRALLRSSVIKWTSINVPGRIVAAIADWGSATSHKYSSKRGRDPAVITDIRRRMKEYVIARAQESEFDMLIMGHTHIREDYSVKVQGREVRFVNLGSWFEPEPKVFMISKTRQDFVEIKHDGV